MDVLEPTSFGTVCVYQLIQVSACLAVGKLLTKVTCDVL